MENSKLRIRSITAVTFILVGNMLTAFDDITNGWMLIATTIIGFVFFFIGLIRIKRYLDAVGRSSITLLIIATSLGILGNALHYIPFLGFIFAGIINLASFIIGLVGIVKLKRSETIGVIGRKGANILLLASIVGIIGGIAGFVPFVGAIVSSVFSLGVCVMVFFGWVKIQEAIIINNLTTISAQPISQQPQPAPQFPSTQANPENMLHGVTSPAFQSINGWLKKYKKIIAGAFASATILYVGYYFFLRNDPIKDAKDSAAAYCDCSTKYNDAMIKIDETFIKSFDTYDFKKRLDARNKLQELQNAALVDNSTCTNNAQQKNSELRNRYSSELEMLIKFNTEYNFQLENCNPSNKNELLTLQSEVIKKISSVKDPEPDIEKIKSDLIGQQITGWRFAYLTDFKSSEIINAAHGNDRIEYQIRFYLGDDVSHNGHECEVMAVYLLGDQGWYFDNVKMIYITYDNTITSGQWVRITPLQNCKFSISDEFKLIWKIDDWGSEYITGPDVPDLVLPYSDSYLVSSRENSSVTVRFTYRPRN